MIGKKMMMWAATGMLSAAMIPAISEARDLAAHKAASSPTPLVASTLVKKTALTKKTTVKPSATLSTHKKIVPLHTTRKPTKLTAHRISHVKLNAKTPVHKLTSATAHKKLTSKTSLKKLTSKPLKATKLHSHRAPAATATPTAAPVM